MTSDNAANGAAVDTAADAALPVDDQQPEQATEQESPAEPAEQAPEAEAAPAEEAAAPEEPAAAEEPEAEVEVDPAEKLRAELKAAPGEWYVVHSYAGYENKVKTNLEMRTQTLDVEDYIFQIEVPTEEVTEIKNGQRKQVQR